MTERLKNLLATVNPFGLMVDGAYKNYTSTIDAYIDVMVQLFKWAPKGYIDIPLFMCEFQGVDLFDAVTICHKRKEIMWFDLLGCDQTSCDEMETLLRRLIEVTGCEFNEQCFLAARVQFIQIGAKIKANMEIQKLLKERENGNEKGEETSEGDKEQ